MLSSAGWLVKQDFRFDEHFTHQFSRFTRRLRSQKNFATFLVNATAGADRLRVVCESFPDHTRIDNCGHNFPLRFLSHLEMNAMNQPASSSPSDREPLPQGGDFRQGSSAVGGEEVPLGAVVASNVITDAKSAWSTEAVARCQALLGRSTCERLAIYALPSGFVLSVIVPIYNEVATIDIVIERLRATGIPMQIVLVDDGSGDGTAGRLQTYASEHDITVISHPTNRGKGAAIRSALDVVTGDIVVIQDADQEYDPEDFRYLMQPILQDRADVVYGTRYGHVDRQVSPLWHEWVNSAITKFANLSLGVRLNDIETCYKMASRRSWEMIATQLREERFGIEIELTSRWVRAGMRFVQRPIRYQHRWYAQGKKIGWRDGVAAIACIVRYGFLRR